MTSYNWYGTYTMGKDCGCETEMVGNQPYTVKFCPVHKYFVTCNKCYAMLDPDNLDNHMTYHERDMRYE